jgi:hypothetical protein
MFASLALGEVTQIEMSLIAIVSKVGIVVGGKLLTILPTSFGNANTAIMILNKELCLFLSSLQ